MVPKLAPLFDHEASGNTKEGLGSPSVVQEREFDNTFVTEIMNEARK